MNINNSTTLGIELTEVYTTKFGSVHQSDSENCWYINFGGRLARYNYSCLIRLKKAVESIDVEQMLLQGTDTEIISICACEYCYILSPVEIVAFKELIQGAFVMFKLNHLIKDCLCRVI